MFLVVGEIAVGKYKLLKLDKSKPRTAYSKYMIDGKSYEAVPVYDAPDNFIAIESSNSFIGQTVSFQ